MNSTNSQNSWENSKHYWMVHPEACVNCAISRYITCAKMQEYGFECSCTFELVNVFNCTSACGFKFPRFHDCDRRPGVLMLEYFLSSNRSNCTCNFNDDDDNNNNGNNCWVHKNFNYQYGLDGNLQNPQPLEL